MIGADVVLGHANRVIAADNSPEFLLQTYSYACLWFLVTGLAVTRLIHHSDQYLRNRES